MLEANKYRSGWKSSTRSSKSKGRSGGQTVGPQVQCKGVRRLASPSRPPHGGSVSASGKRFSGPLPLMRVDAHG